MKFGISTWTISLQHAFQKSPEEKRRHKVQTLFDALRSWGTMQGNSKNDESGNFTGMWAEAHKLNWIHS